MTTIKGEMSPKDGNSNVSSVSTSRDVSDDDEAALESLGSEAKLTKEEKAMIKKHNKHARKVAKAEKKIQKKIDKEAGKGVEHNRGIAPPPVPIKWVIPTGIPPDEEATTEKGLAKTEKLRPLVMAAAEESEFATATEIEEEGFLSETCIMRYACARKKVQESLALWKEAIELTFGERDSNPHPSSKAGNMKFLKECEEGSNAKELMVLRKYVPLGTCGLDKRGVPYYYQRLGTVDFSGLAREAGNENLSNYIWSTYIAPEQARNAAAVSRGSHPVRYVSITDMSNMVWSRTYAGLQIYKALAKDVNIVRPEVLHCAYVTNVSSMFMLIWKIAKVWLAEDTLSKVRLIPEGADLNEVLSEHIDIEEQPDFYGGGFDCKHIPSGGWVPLGVANQVLDDNHTVSNDADGALTVALATDGEAQDVVVAAGMTKVATVMLKKGQKIEFTLSLAYYDCDYTITAMPVGSDDDVKAAAVVDKSRLDTTGEQSHAYTATADGEVVRLELDNTYSYFRSKTVAVKAIMA